MIPNVNKKLEEGGKSGEDGKSYVTNSAAVVNLSGRNLSQSEISLLSKGLKFISTPKSINMSEIKEDLEKFGRNLRLKLHFRNNVEDFSYNPFKHKSTF